jgi:hypothetical protein
MAHVYTPERSRSAVSFRIPDALFGYAVLLVLGFLVIFGIRRMSIAMPVSSNVPAPEFSTDRAMQYLGAIAQRARPIGSAAHDEVRDYIVSQLNALGLKPEIQKAKVVFDDKSIFLSAATVENIIVRLGGTDNTKAVMLMGHYDSMPNSLGASDDGSAVAAMLEAARALLAGPSLKNDVILLFTDCEEAGMMGARAFVGEHRWAKDVGLALNFDALGTGGPLVLFETGNQNGWVIQEFARAACYPVGNSLANEIYKLTPYGTDLGVFKEAGYSGLNFAYVNRPAHHHALSDSVDNIDRGTIEHIGNYALNLTRHFGDLNLEEVKKPDAVYFDVFGFALFHYSKKVALGLAAFLVVAFAGVATYGFKRGRLTWRAAGLGTLAFLSSLIVAPLIIAGVWMAIWLLNGRSAHFNSDVLMAGLVALAIAIVATIYVACEKRITAENLAIGALFWWLILAVFSAVFVPGGSYLFSWPLLAGLVGLAILFSGVRGSVLTRKRLALVFVFSTPAIILLLPLNYLTYMTLGLQSCAGIMVAVVFMLGPLVPQLKLIPGAKRWILPAGLATVGLILSVTGSFTSRLFDEQSPKQNSIFYVLNSDNGKAIWVSYDHSADEWTSQFLTATPQRGSLIEYLPTSFAGFSSAPAPLLSLEGPNATLLSDTAAGETRTARLRISSVRKAPLITVFLATEGPIKSLTIDGKQLSNLNTRVGINYFGLPPEGIEMIIETSASKQIKVRALDQSYELPEVPNSSFKPRPANVVPAITPYSDMTLVSRSFKF